MKIIVFQPEDLNSLPPSITLLKILSENHNVIFVSKSANTEYISFLNHNKINFYFRINKIRYRYGIFPSLIENFINNCLIRRYINYNYRTEESIIWTTTDSGALILSNLLIGKKNVLQLMELIQKEKISLNTPFSVRKSIKNIALASGAVVVPEYNRAHILKAWWNLKKLPFILPNKPAYHPLKRELKITNIDAEKIISDIKKTGKKIILYQGALNEQRNLFPFIDFVSKSGGNYALVIMGPFNQFTQRYIEKGENIFFIPWISAPQHLEVTSWAAIGILSYLPVQMGDLSVLNAVYCAPNKIFEYSGFGIPFISNDCPGITSVILNNNIGAVVNFDNIKSIEDGISKIESNYIEFSLNAIKYFNSINMYSIINDILESVK